MERPGAAALERPMGLLSFVRFAVAMPTSDVAQLLATGRPDDTGGRRAWSGWRLPQRDRRMFDFPLGMAMMTLMQEHIGPLAARRPICLLPGT